MAKTGKPHFKKGRKKLPKLVVRLSPSTREARDEGPRLLPLDKREPQPRHFGAVDHYLDLADKALRSKLKNKDEKNQS